MDEQEGFEDDKEKKKAVEALHLKQVLCKGLQGVQAYKKVQDDVRKAVKKAKKDFEKKLAKNTKKKSKMFWSYMKQKHPTELLLAPWSGTRWSSLMTRRCARY